MNLLRKRTLAASLIAFLATVTANAQAAPDTDGVRAAMAGFLAALNALDADGMVAFFTDDVTAFVPTAQPDRVEGREAVGKIFRDFVARTKATTPRLHLVPEDLQAEASGDLGMVTFNIRDAETRVVRRRTFLFRRVGSRWLICHFHASDAAMRQAKE
jgi:ketosteroid isomerase-like protein